MSDPNDSGNPAMQQAATPCNNKILTTTAGVLNYLAAPSLSQRQRNTLELLLQGLTDAQVAAQLGIDRTTVFRWRTGNGLFQRELDAQRQAMWRQSVERLRAMVHPALDILQKQMTGDDPRTALRAAAILLRFATPGRMGGDDVDEEKSSAAQRAEKSEALWDKIESYVNAPLPGPLGIDTRRKRGSD